MSDAMWNLLTYLKKNPLEDSQGEASAQAENEKRMINEQLMATLERTERAIDDAAAASDRELIETSDLDGVPGMSVEETPAAQEGELSEDESFLASMATLSQIGDETAPPHPNAEFEHAQAMEHEGDAPTSEKEAEVAAELDGKRLMNIAVSMVRPNPYQPRKVMGENEIDELSRSIRQFGVLQPILVRPDGDMYELIAGERRLRAAQRAGLTEIPAIVAEPDPMEQQLMALIENIQRKNLTAIEEAICFQDIISKTNISQTELAHRTGRSQSSIANKLRLLRLDRSVQELIMSGKLGERQARSLLNLSLDEQRELAQRAIDEDLSAKALEDLAEDWNAGKVPGTAKPKKKNEGQDGPGGKLLDDLASLINKHRNRGTSAQWKVKQMDEDALIVEISVDLSSEE